MLRVFDFRECSTMKTFGTELPIKPSEWQAAVKLICGKKFPIYFCTGEKLFVYDFSSPQFPFK